MPVTAGLEPAVRGVDQTAAGVVGGRGWHPAAGVVVKAQPHLVALGTELGPRQAGGRTYRGGRAGRPLPRRGPAALPASSRREAGRGQDRPPLEALSDRGRFPFGA